MQFERVLIPYNDDDNKFNTDYPPHLQQLMSQEDFLASINYLNQITSTTVSTLTRAFHVRIAILATIGLSIIGIPVMIVLSIENDITLLLIIPAVLILVVFVGAVIFSMRHTTSVVTYQAVSAIEPSLREFNNKCLSKGIIWRLHKMADHQDDFEIENSSGYTHWIEIEVDNANIAVIVD